MEEHDMADETVEAAPVEEVVPVEQTQEAPVAEPTQDEQHAPEQPTPEPEKPTEEAPVAPVEEPDEQAPQVPQLQAVDANSFVDENGIFDVNAYNQAMINNQQQTIATATAQIRAEIDYKGQWDEAMDAYPELKDAKVRDMVAAYHIQQSTNGKYISPKKAAKAFFDYTNNKAVGAKEEGKKEATETTRVQASAHLESAGTAAGNTDLVSDLKTQLANANDPSERNKLSQQILKELVKSGRI